MHNTSTKRACDSVMKISKIFFSNITYITLSSNHVIPKHQQVELPRLLRIPSHVRITTLFILLILDQKKTVYIDHIYA